MDLISVLIHSVPVVVGIALVVLALDAKEPQGKKISLITGIVLIVLGLLIR
jgi:uncharacterized membrane protein HdeD (DUF308 family)